MNGADPLAQLRDIHLPEPVSIWPLAPGWWILLTLLLAAALGAFLWWRNYRRKTAYRRLAIEELEQAFQGRQKSSEENFVMQCQNILKRAALHSYPAEPIAAMNGKTWSQWLAQQVPDKYTVDFAVLGEGLYKANTTSNHQETAAQQTLYKDCQAWLKHHNIKKKGGHK